MAPRVTTAAPAYCRNPGTKYLVHDLGSGELGDVHNRLLALLARAEYIQRKQNKTMSTLLILPSLLLPPLHSLAHSSLQLSLLASSGPSVSVEALPRWQPVFWDTDGSVTPLSMLLGGFRSLQGFSLSLLNVTMGQVSTVDVNQVDTGG